MASSAAISIDFVDSYARLRDDDVEIVLGGLGQELLDTSSLLLAQGDATVKASAHRTAVGDANLLVARTLRADLFDGTWTVNLDDERALDARLLVQGTRPVVLLLGASAPPSRAPKPRRAGATPHEATPGPVSTKQKVAAAGGRVIDRVLKVLPAERAAQVRGRVRNGARRVLG